MKTEKPKLVVLGGPMDGLAFDLDKSILRLGRGDDNEIFLPLDPIISRHHAQLLVKEGEYSLEDVGSTHGTFVGGSEKRIVGPVQIQLGNIFRVGLCTSLKLMMVDSEKKLVQRASRFVQSLHQHLPEVPQDNWVALKAHIVSILRKLENVTSKAELYGVLQEMTAAISEAVGEKIPFGLSVSPESPPPPPPDSPEAKAAQPPDEAEALKTLKSFFKSNLDEIVEKMASQESRESKS